MAARQQPHPAGVAHGWLSTTLLVGAVALFLVLCVSELVDTFG